MNQPSFSSILDQPASAEDWNRPAPLPVGSYICLVDGLPERGQSQQKQTDFIRFNLRPIEALNDVDTDALQAYGPINEQTIPLTFWVTEKSRHRLGEFLNDLGIKVNKKTPWTAAQEAPGNQVLVSIRHRPTQDGKGFFAEITSTGAVS